MAIKIDLSNVKTYLPSWDGPIVCPECKGNAHSMGGPNYSQKMVFRSWCFDCDWNDGEEKDLGE